MALGKLDFPKFTKEHVLPGTLPATTANYGYIFVADRPCVVEGFSVRYGTASTAARTVQLRKVPSGVTIAAAGTASDILAAGVALNGATATDIVGTPVKNTEVLVGEALAIVPSDAPTNLANAIFSVKLKYVRPQ